MGWSVVVEGVARDLDEQGNLLVEMAQRTPDGDLAALSLLQAEATASVFLEHRIIAAERAEGERARELAVAMAREALTRLANTEAAVAEEGSDEPVGAAQTLADDLADVAEDELVDPLGDGLVEAVTVAEVAVEDGLGGACLRGELVHADGGAPRADRADRGLDERASSLLSMRLPAGAAAVGGGAHRTDGSRYCEYLLPSVSYKCTLGGAGIRPDRPDSNTHDQETCGG